MEEDKDATVAATVSQKKKQAKKAIKERRRDSADGQDGSQKEEHAEEQKDTERTETKEEEERQKEETDFMRTWSEPIYRLENTKGTVGPRRPWMQGIRESEYDFSTLEEDDYYSEVVVAQEHVLSTDFAALSLENGVPLDGIGRGGALEADAAREVHVERNMEQETVEESLPGDMSDEQWFGANSDNDSDNVTLWYTDQVRKWYWNAVESLKSQKYAPTRMYTHIERDTHQHTHTHTQEHGQMTCRLTLRDKSLASSLECLLRKRMSQSLC